jgi:MIP family channel proteins
MKKYAAELIGTFALVFVGAGVGALMNDKGIGVSGLITIAFAHGLILAAMIYALGHISGIHINPAVTVAMKVTGKISNADFIGYIIAQLIGAALAGYMLRALYNPGIGTGFLGATTLATGVSPKIGLLCETVGTFLFFMVIFGAAVDGRTAGNNVGLAIGLSLTALIMVFGPFTGASFNPARTFGPALASGHWDNFWVYIVGPILGGSLAGIAQTKFFMKD